MAELTDILKNNAIPTKRIIHDCVDTGTTLSIIGGVELNFPCDCVTRDYKSTTTELWDKTTSIFKDSIDNSKMHVKIKFTVNGNLADTVLLKIFVPHPTLGDISVDELTIVVPSNVDANLHASLLLYNGTDADSTTYGFKVTITPSATMDLKARSILVVV